MEQRRWEAFLPWPQHSWEAVQLATDAVVAADASGLAIALTTTVNLLFGSHLMIPETGVICNKDQHFQGTSRRAPARTMPDNIVRQARK